MLYYKSLKTWEVLEDPKELSIDLRTLENNVRNDPEAMKRLQKFQAHWRAITLRRVSSLHFLEHISKYVRGFVVYMHGSGGMTGNNLRYARMLAGMGYVVVCPDHMAGEYRSRVLAPLPTKESNTDYWNDNLVYASDTKGEYAYSTQVQGVLEDPEKYKVLYEKVYKARRAELHCVLSKLPPFVERFGVYIMGTSEGAMTVARFDDQRYGSMINGRIISAFGVEYCYFTPTEDAAKFGGNLRVPTLQVIGTHDQYFGAKESVAQLVAADAKRGYGSKDLNGHALETMRTQKMLNGCVCVLDQEMHDPTTLYDNFLRDLFQTFLNRPTKACEIDEIFKHDAFLSDQVVVKEKVQHEAVLGGLLHLFIKKSPFPSTTPKDRVDALRLIHSHVASKSDNALNVLKKQTQAMLTSQREEANKMFEDLKKQLQSK
jgi:dienelactone hydrolase